MDTRISRPKRSRAKLIALVALSSVVVVATASWLIRPNQPSLNVPMRAVETGVVTKGDFDDFVPIRASVLPIRTQFVEAVESGRVETVLVEEGAEVSVDQLLIELSNTSLQLDTIGREADIAEQLNNLSTSKLRFEQNQIEHRRNLLEIDWNVDRLESLLKRQNELSARNLVAEIDISDIERELAYWSDLRSVTVIARETDTRLQKMQIEQLDNMVTRLSKNLEAARLGLDNLKVRSPIDGILSSLVVNEGQVLSKGDRIGQIDDATGFKLTSQIEEYYLPRVSVQQDAIAFIDQSEFPVFVSNVYPQVVGGQFRIDLRFASTVPPNIRNGQSITARLILGESSQSLLLPSGRFYNDTGGNWVFVVSENRQYAERRNVVLGNRSSEFIEVVSGLSAGDVVVTSSYAEYLDYDRLNFTD